MSVLSLSSCAVFIHEPRPSWCFPLVDFEGAEVLLVAFLVQCCCNRHDYNTLFIDISTGFSTHEKPLDPVCIPIMGYYVMSVKLSISFWGGNPTPSCRVYALHPCRAGSNCSFPINPQINFNHMGHTRLPHRVFSQYRNLKIPKTSSEVDDRPFPIDILLSPGRETIHWVHYIQGRDVDTPVDRLPQLESGCRKPILGECREVPPWVPPFPSAEVRMDVTPASVPSSRTLRCMDKFECPPDP